MVGRPARRHERGWPRAAARGAGRRARRRRSEGHAADEEDAGPVHAGLPAAGRSAPALPRRGGERSPLLRAHARPRAGRRNDDLRRRRDDLHARGVEQLPGPGDRGPAVLRSPRTALARRGPGQPAALHARDRGRGDAGPARTGPVARRPQLPPVGAPDALRGGARPRGPAFRGPGPRARAGRPGHRDRLDAGRRPRRRGDAADRRGDQLCRPADGAGTIDARPGRPHAPDHRRRAAAQRLRPARTPHRRPPGAVRPRVARPRLRGRGRLRHHGRSPEALRRGRSPIPAWRCCSTSTGAT